MSVTRRSIGVNFNDQDEAEIRLWAPFAKEVGVENVTGRITLALEKQQRGYWTLKTDRLKPEHRYLFLLDGEKRLPDPASVAQPDGVHEASRALDLKYNWEDQDWQNFPLKDYIFYELHAGTFSPSGDFSGIETRLDHLVSLGITAIEIMPIAAFPGDRNWGYDGVFPFAVQQSYGGARALQQLVEACHARGLAVVLDVVYNHVGPEGNYLNEFGPYFTEKYHTPWGNAVNFDDRECDGVREFVVENVLMWFRDFHIDALRLDAVHAIKDYSAFHILQEIRTKTDELMRITGRKHYLIVELDLNDPRYIDPLEKNGLGMDGQWVDEFHHALRVTAGERKVGYYADFNGIEDLAKSYRDGYVYTGGYSEERQRKFGREAVENPGSQFVVFSQNHDQVGNRMLGERTGTLVSFEMQKLLAASVVCSPFLPMLFMGEEWGETNPFLYFVSHTDPALVEAVRKGRKEEFKAMHTEGEAPDPQSEDTFNASKLQWDLLDMERHRTMFAFYKYMISLRKKNKVLSNGYRSGVKTVVLKEINCLIVERRSEDGNDAVVCLMNFSGAEQQIEVPVEGTWQKIADSASLKWGGASDAADTITSKQQVTIQPESFIAYSLNHV